MADSAERRPDRQERGWRFRQSASLAIWLNSVGHEVLASAVIARNSIAGIDAARLDRMIAGQVRRVSDAGQAGAAVDCAFAHCGDGAVGCENDHAR